MRKRFRTFAAALLATALAMLGFASAAVADVDSATLDSTSQRTLTIHKYEGPANTSAACTPNGQPMAAECLTGVPLKGAEFTIYKVMDLNTNEDWVAASQFYGGVAPDPIPAAWTEVATVTTGDNGSIAYDFGVGVNALYYVVETKLPTSSDPNVTYTGAVPFFVTVPMTMPDNQTWDYSVDVYPKNDKFEAPHKAVFDDPTYEIGDPVDYRVSVTIPKYADVVGAPAGTPPVYTAKDGVVNRYDVGSYSILDIFSAHLTYNSVPSVRIFPEGVDPTTYDAQDPAPTDIVTLTPTTDYSVLTRVNTDGTTSVQVVLTGPGLDKFAAAGGQQLVVDFATTLASIPDNGQIPNQAWTLPGDKPMEGGTPPTPPTTPEEPDEPTNTVVTKLGNIRIYKTGVTGLLATNRVALEGAVFEIFHAQATYTATNGWQYSCDREYLKTQTSVGQFTTDADGAGVSGPLGLSNWYNDGVEASPTGNNDGYLDGAQYADKYGWRNYCLVETTAPEGYQLLANPVLVSLVEEGLTTTVPVTDWANITNQADNVGAVLPLTGGQGVALISIAGMALVGGGLGYFALTNRRRQKV